MQIKSNFTNEVVEIGAYVREEPSKFDKNKTDKLTILLSNDLQKLNHNLLSEGKFITSDIVGEPWEVERGDKRIVKAKWSITYLGKDGNVKAESAIGSYTLGSGGDINDAFPDDAAIRNARDKCMLVILELDGFSRKLYSQSEFVADENNVNVKKHYIKNANESPDFVNSGAVNTKKTEKPAKDENKTETKNTPVDTCGIPFFGLNSEDVSIERDTEPTPEEVKFSVVDENVTDPAPTPEISLKEAALHRIEFECKNKGKTVQDLYKSFGTQFLLQCLAHKENPALAKDIPYIERYVNELKKSA